MPNLVVVTGFPRAGKGWVSLLSSAVLGIGPKGVLDTDTIRKEAILERAIPYELRYSQESMQKVYDRMIDKARDRLSAGLDVIMSATFSRTENRNRVRALAKEFQAQLHIFYVDCPEKIIRERLEEGIPIKREGSNGSDLPSVFYVADDSEAGLEVYEAIKNNFCPIDDPDLVVDGSKPSIQIMKQLNSYFGKINMPILAF